MLTDLEDADGEKMAVDERLADPTAMDIDSGALALSTLPSNRVFFSSLIPMFHITD